jgi:hypothetical protein
MVAKGFGMFSFDEYMAHHKSLLEKSRKKEKDYEEGNLSGWHWCTFGFDRICELCSSTKNDHHKKQPVHFEREMGGVEYL